MPLPARTLGAPAPSIVARPAGKFTTSRFPGGEALIRTSAPVDNVNQLIDQVAQQTGVAPETVHKILSLAFQSTARFVLERASEFSLQQAAQRLGVALPGFVGPAV